MPPALFATLRQLVLPTSNISLASLTYHLMLIFCSASKTSARNYDSTIKCYSCMSKLYDVAWGYVDHMYKPPLAFTDRCSDDQFNRRFLGIKNCSICMTIVSQESVMGQRMEGYARGCLTDLIVKNVSILQPWLTNNFCSLILRKDLFRAKSPQSSPTGLEGHVLICSCHSGDFCNAGNKSDSWTTPSVPFLCGITLAAIVKYYLASLA